MSVDNNSCVSDLQYVCDSSCPGASGGGREGEGDRGGCGAQMILRYVPSTLFPCCRFVNMFPPQHDRLLVSILLVAVFATNDFL